MSQVLVKFKDDITQVFGIVVDVLNGARSLKSISLDLKLLAINGIVQAAKIGSNQGKSLITLSGFLSDLPLQIAPELEKLEKLAGDISENVTVCSVAVRRFMVYSNSISDIFKVAYDRNDNTFLESDSDVLKKFKLERDLPKKVYDDLSEEEINNIKQLQEKIAENRKIIDHLLHESHKGISQVQTRIESIRRNGLIANYMGTSISIESAYLDRNSSDFSGLVGNIHEMVVSLEANLNKILDKIVISDNIVLKLISGTNQYDK